MSLKDDLFKYVEDAQAEADCSFQQYPENQAVLPNDALYLGRICHLKDFCELVEGIVNKTGKSVEEVLSLAIKPELEAVHKQFPWAIQAINLIVEQYPR